MERIKVIGSSKAEQATFHIIVGARRAKGSATSDITVTDASAERAASNIQWPSLALCTDTLAARIDATRRPLGDEIVPGARWSPARQDARVPVKNTSDTRRGKESRAR